MRRLLSPGAGVLALAAAVAACAQTPPPRTPETEASQPVAPVAVMEPVPEAFEDEARGEAVQAPAEDEKAPAEAAARAEARRNSTETAIGRAGDGTRRDTTVIAVPGSEPKPRTLWEAAVVAREKREQSPPVRTSVTDENLHEFQGTELTVASPRPQPAQAEAGAEADGAAEEASEARAAVPRGEEYWRSRVLDLRLRLRAAVDELAELDERAAGLRRSFYAADDPYLRDIEIKPAWDRALDRRGELRRELARVAGELEKTLEEGRRAGALPGWLRAGIELEPEPEELPRSPEPTHEPGEPKVMDERPPASGHPSGET